MRKLVFVENGQAVTDSLMVAEVFNKRHSDVIRNIETLSCSKEFTERNFTLSDYEDSTGRKLKKFLISRDGLVFLVMGFTGKRAAQFKEMYINEFNKMETKIKELYPVASYMIDDPIKRAEKWIEEHKQRLMLEQQVAESQPKVTYYDTILKSSKLVTITQIAKDYGLSGQALNKILHQEGIQYKLGGQWLLYHGYADKGYTKSHTHIDSTGEARMNTKWTQKGRLFIHEILTRLGHDPDQKNKSDAPTSDSKNSFVI